jgi:4-diphosphocytidyl-2-C-methyl-D-erythritol kinase
MTMITLHAPAKINWHLSVTGKRPDGFHEVLTVMQTVSLHDTLVFKTADTLELVSEMDVPVEENLVMLAARLIHSEMESISTLRPRPNIGARIRLEKVVPEQAGMGGGSSDAAATLVGLNELWRLGLTLPELLRLAAMLGSDVPFFIRGGTALAEGRGEVVTALEAPAARNLVIVKPPFGVPTAWAYGRVAGVGKYSQRPPDAMEFAGELIAALDRLDFPALKNLMRNDLRDAVAAEIPEIAQIEVRLMESGAGAALMSGSGSAVFGLFADAEAARRAHEQLGATLPDCRVECVRTVGEKCFGWQR